LKKKVFFLLFVFISFRVRSQVPDSLSLSVKSKQNIIRNENVTPYVIPAACIGYGFVAQHNKLLEKIDHNINADIREDRPGFATHIDNYLQYTPVAAVYTLNFMGIKGKNNFIDRTAIYVISNGIMSASVTLFKKKMHRLRPDGSSYTSFPSGHTATAFGEAEFLAQEYNNVSLWYGITGYTFASATGILRMYNNAHWFSDVVAGAGFGILSTKVAYLIYPYLKHKIFHDKTVNILAIPTYQDGTPGFSIFKSFK
jgi:membrane-associated phospholipid phosphatase